MKKRILQFRMTAMTVMFSLVFGVVGIMNGQAQSFTYGNLNYSINSNGTSVTITGHVDGTSASGILIIPSSISYEGSVYGVTAIRASAFYNCAGLTGAITLPNSIVTVGNYAFYGCSNISELTIGEGVTSIGEKAFWNCSSLSIVHYNAVNCSSMQNPGFPIYSVFGITPPITELTIGSTVQTIPSYAFYSCTNISGQLDIPNSVTTIGEYAFFGCSGFSGNLNIPNTITSIGRSTFSGCSGLSGNLVIPNTITSIGGAAFSGCGGFTGILSIPNSVVTIGNSAFSNCSGFTGVSIPSSVSLVDGYTFSNCSGITSVVLPNSIITIGMSAFENCTSLTTITIPSSVSSIGWWAFENTGWYNNQPDGVLYLDGWCLGYKGAEMNPNVEIQEGTIHIADGAFMNNMELSSIILPNSLVSIGSLAFEMCGHLVSVTFGNSLTSIGNDAFSSCSELIAVELPNSLLRIEDRAFFGSGLHSVVIPDAVNYIGESAFEFCYMHTLFIGASVIEIGNNAFANCEGLRNVFSYASTPPTFGEDVFINDGLYNTFTLYVPENAISDYQNAPIGVTFDDILPMTEIDDLIYSYDNTRSHAKVIGCRRECHGELNIPSSIFFNGNTYSVNSIGDAAFYENTKITTLNIPNTIVTIGEFAFYFCNKLVGKLIIPNSVTNIGRDAFSYCSGFIGDLIIPNSVITIGISAFSGCNGLDGSLIIGNSLTNIGSYAFVGCSRIKEIWSKCETPPSTGWYPFSGIDRNIPVYVPCGSQSAYNSASYWKAFTNYHESPYYLVAKPSSEYFGEAIVLQYGDCENDESIVHAEPYFGAVFTGWAVNGELVSTEMDYTFPLTDDMVLTAHFEPAPNHFVFVGATNQWSDPSNWEPNGLPAETSIVGVWSNVEIDGNVCVNSLVVYGDNSVTILPNSSLTVLDTLVTPNASSLVIKEGGELVHSCNGVLATIEKSISPYTEGGSDGWNLMALPLAGSQEVSLIENLTNNDYDLYYYDEPTKYWMNQKVASNAFTELESGKGYLCANKGEMSTVFSFDDGLEGWTTINPEGNNSSWHHVSNASGSHSGEGYVSSAISWHNVSGNYFSDDDYFVSPLVQFTASSSISFGVYTMDWIYEHFAVAVSTAGNTDASDFTTIQEFVSFEKSKAEGDSLRGGIWVRYTVDLSQYANQTGYIAIRHYECTDMQHTLRVDDVELSGMGNMRNPVELSFAGELKSSSVTVSITLSYSTTAGSLKGLNLVGNPFACNAYLLDENNDAIPFYRMNNTGDTIVAAPAGTAIKPCEGVFVICLNDRELHSAIFTTTAPTNIGETQTVPEVLLPIHDLLVNQNASLTNSVTQTVTISEGWNWFSTNLEITLDDLENALVAAYPNVGVNSLIIKSNGGGQTAWNPTAHRWIGGLNTLDLSQMYMIKVANAGEIMLEGMPINLADHPVTIANGNNWIAFPLSVSMTVTDVFEGFPVNGDVVKSNNGGQATWNSNANRWIGGLTTLEPGKGYIYNSKASGNREFTFPISTK